MSIELFRDLNRDWSITARSRRSRRAVARWKAQEPVLGSVADLDAIIGRIGSSNRPDQDAIFAALLRLGHDDPLAWRAVLHALMPGLVCVARRFLPGRRQADEVAATVAACAWDRIACYPLDRRPRSIAANIVLDTRQLASARLFRHIDKEVPTAELTEYRATSPVSDPSMALVRLLDHAVKRQVVSADDARLVALTRITDVPVEELATEQGVLPHSLRRRRLRIEAALSAAVA